MKKNILIIGKNSFLASGIYERCSLNKNLNITLVSHSNLPSCYKNFDWVVNCAFNSSLYSQPIKDKNNFDLKVIKEIKNNKNIKYVLLSSRAVYGSHETLLMHDESFEAEESLITQYGLNKLACEKMALSELGSSRVLICRCSNIFGFERGNNFLGIAQKSLLEKNEIILDISKKVIKDFLPLNYYSEIMESLITNGIVGTYNIGSGIKISLEEICGSLINGYGSGSINDCDNLFNNQFVLDTSNLSKVINFSITKEIILSYAYSVGKHLKEENSGI
jgi:nucleoside-diphosphate-sugar epimerase